MPTRTSTAIRDTVVVLQEAQPDTSNPFIKVLELIFRAAWFVLWWIVVPFLLLGMLAWTIAVLQKIQTSEQKTSARAGLWCGIIASLVVIATQSSQFVPPTFESGSVVMNLAVAGVAAAVGFVFLWVIKWLLPTRLVGLLIMIVSFASLSSLYAYFFVAPLRVVVFPAALGLAFGTYFHQVIFPEALLTNLVQEPDSMLEG